MSDRYGWRVFTLAEDGQRCVSCDEVDAPKVLRAAMYGGTHEL